MPDYQIDVGVEPDASGFPQRLRAELTKAEEGSRIEVPVSPQLDKGFRREVEQRTKAALADLDAQVKLSPQVSKTFRRDVQRQLKTTLRGESVELPVAPTLARSFRRDLRRSVKESTKGLDLSVPIGVSLAPGIRTALKRELKEKGPDNLTVDIRPTISGQSYAVFVRELVTKTAQAAEFVNTNGVLDLRPGVDTKGFVAELSAEVGAATTAVSGTEAASVEVRADTSAATTQIAAVGAEARAAETGLGGLSKAGIVAGGALIATGAAAAGAGFALFKVGENFDAAFDLIQTRTGKTGKALAGLEGDFRAVAASVPSEFGDVSTAVAELNQRLGLTGPTLQGVSAQVLDLSRITGTDLAGNIQNAAGALQSFQIPAAQIPAALDALFRASQASGVGVDVLGGQLLSLGPALRTAGFGFSESTALLAQLQRAGVPAEQVIGSLSIAARKLAKDGKDPAVAIGELVTQIKEAKNPTDALALAQGTFGRSAVSITDAIRSGKFELGDFLAVVRDGKGTIEGTSQATADAAESWQLLKNNLMLALETPAAQVFGQVGAAVKGLIPVVGQLGPSLAELAGGLGSAASGLISGIVPVVKELVPAVAPIGKVLGDVFRQLGPTIAPVAGAIGHLLASASPLLTVVGQLAGTLGRTLAPVITGLAKGLEPLVQVFAFGLTAALKALAPFIVQIGQKLGGFFAKLGPILAQALIPALENLGPMLPDIGEALVELADAAVQLLVAFLPLLLPLVRFSNILFTKIQLPLLLGLVKAVALLARVLSPLVAVVSDILGAGLDKLTDLLVFLTRNISLENLGKVGEFLAGVGRAIGSFFQALPGQVLGFLRALPGQVVAALSGLGALAGRVLLSGLRFAGRLVYEGITGMIAYFVSMPFRVADALLRLPGVIVDGISRGVRLAVRVLPGLIGAVLGFFASLPGRIVGLLASLPGRAVAVFRQLFGLARSAVSAGVSATAAIFTTLPGKVLGVLGRLLSAGRRLGGALIDGLKDGLRSAVGVAGDIASGVGSALRRAINGLIDKVNDAIPNRLGKGLLSVDIPDNPIPHLAAGGMFTTPTLAVVGEAGPELVLPLSDPARMAQLLRDAGVVPPGTTAAAVGASASGQPGAVAAQSPTGADPGGLPPVRVAIVGDTQALEDWIAQVVALLTPLGQRLIDTDLPGLRVWRDQLGQLFTSLRASAQSFTDQTVAGLAGWASFRVPAATVGPLGAWRAQVAATAQGAAGSLAQAWRTGTAQLAPIASAAGTSAAGALAATLGSGATKVQGITDSYAQALASALNPILSAVGQDRLPIRRAEGGPVPGPRVRQDVVPALLMPGEVVIRRDSVDRFGLGNLLALNAGQVPAGWVVPRRFADGGQVASASGTAALSGAVGRASSAIADFASVAGQGFPPGPPTVPGGDLGRAASGAMGKTYRGAQDWIGRQGNFGGVGAAAAAVWIRTAMALTGVPDSWFLGLMTIARRESSFNPRSINLWDSNAAKGTPSIGLMQTIAPTFRAYALPGHGDIYNPVDNAVAAIRYILGKYGDISRVQQANPAAAPRGYAEGGLVTREGLYRLAARQDAPALSAFTRPGRSSTSSGSAAPARAGEPTIGQVVVQVTAPAATDPEGFGMVLGSRLAPTLAKVVAPK